MSFVLTRTLVALTSFLSFASAYSEKSERAARPMMIHHVIDLGLEIWTEKQPRWETRVEQGQNYPRFIAETPALTYPPAGFSWVRVKEMGLADSELREGARGAIYQAARNYGVSPFGVIQLTSATYGELSGYEANFAAYSHGTPVDVRLFFGRRNGSDAVMIHAYTIRGKMTHLAEQIRRSWAHTRYLP